MAKLATLDLHLTNLEVTRLGPWRYSNKITCRDWDDVQRISFTTTTEFPIIAISSFKVRIQVEDLLESPKVE